MARLYARSPPLGASHGSVSRNRGKNTMLIASMTLKGDMGEVTAFENSAKTCISGTYVEERLLAPTLREGEIMVMDNLGTHKTERGSRLIDERLPVVVLAQHTRRTTPRRGSPLPDKGNAKGNAKEAVARTQETLVETMGKSAPRSRSKR